MAQNTDATDERTRNEQIKMATWFDEERAEIEDSDRHEIVHEDEHCIIVADHTGHEIDEWADRLNTDRERLRRTFRALAEETMGEQESHEVFSYADPVVFDTLED